MLSTIPVNNDTRCEVYLIQHYVMKFVINLRHVVVFLRVLRFPPPITTGRHDMTEILLKIALNTITITPENHKGKDR